VWFKQVLLSNCDAIDNGSSQQTVCRLQSTRVCQQQRSVVRSLRRQTSGEFRRDVRRQSLPHLQGEFSGIRQKLMLCQFRQ